MYLQSNFDNLPEVQTAFSNEVTEQETGTNEVMQIPTSTPSSLPSKLWIWVLIGLIVAWVMGLIYPETSKSKQRKF